MTNLLRACLLATIATATADAQDDTSPSAVTELTIVEHPSQEELEAGFTRWAERHPDAFAYESRGTTLAEGPLEHGIVIRLLVPYGDATVTEVRLDGHLLEESETDGYHLTRDPGVIVEVAIPPGKVKELHIVSCHYDTPTRRRAGFGAAAW